mmetsp:Transcript_27421/g.72001  ORF Transcript_27421/g.72001 Transcript_27421/m.72001 type:complete len:213 (+) Transcript_27421:1243-1881(+)
MLAEIEAIPADSFLSVPLTPRIGPITDSSEKLLCSEIPSILFSTSSCSYAALSAASAARPKPWSIASDTECSDEAWVIIKTEIASAFSTSITRRVTAVTESCPPALTSIIATAAIEVTILTAPSGARMMASMGDLASTVVLTLATWSAGTMCVPEKTGFRMFLTTSRMRSSMHGVIALGWSTCPPKYASSIASSYDKSGTGKAALHIRGSAV